MVQDEENSVIQNGVTIKNDKIALEAPFLRKLSLTTCQVYANLINSRVYTSVQSAKSFNTLFCILT